MSVQCSEFRRDDPTRTESLNAEHLKRSWNAIPNQLAVLQFDVWPHELSFKDMLTILVEKAERSDTTNLQSSIFNCGLSEMGDI
jgi:hypothetical protein